MSCDYIAIGLTWADLERDLPALGLRIADRNEDGCLLACAHGGDSVIAVSTTARACQDTHTHFWGDYGLAILKLLSDHYKVPIYSDEDRWEVPISSPEYWRNRLARDA